MQMPVQEQSRAASAKDADKTHTHACTRTRTHTRTDIHAHTRAHAHTHTHTHTLAHAHAHTHTQLDDRQSRISVEIEKMSCTTSARRFLPGKDNRQSQHGGAEVSLHPCESTPEGNGPEGPRIPPPVLRWCPHARQAPSPPPPTPPPPPPAAPVHGVCAPVALRGTPPRQSACTLH